MSMARLVITAVTVEGRWKSEVARDYGVSRVWVQKLVRRYQREGPAAFEPRSRRPHSNPRAVDLEVEDQIVRLRKTLTKKGVDAGAETIAAHLQMAGVSPVPAVSTIWLEGRSPSIMLPTVLGCSSQVSKVVRIKLAEPAAEVLAQARRCRRPRTFPKFGKPEQEVGVPEAVHGVEEHRPASGSRLRICAGPGAMASR